MSSKPAVFSEATFANALDETRRSNRWLIVDATAEWCGPCKNMDRTTWVDPEVVAWMQAHAVALQIDVDRDEIWARRHEIRAMPTIIAFKGGEAVDRVVGAKNPRQLLEWLAGLERGETSLDQLRHAAGDLDRNVRGRFDIATTLLERGQLDEATKEFVWLWEHMAEVEPAMGGVRVSFLASRIADLTRRHEPAQRLFRDIRDRTETSKTDEARFDWVVLNQTLGDDDRTLAWFESMTTEPGVARRLAMFEHRITPLLLARGRWRDAALLVEDGVKDFVRYHAQHSDRELPGELDEEFKKHFEEMNQTSIRKEAAVVRQILLAAGRDAEARAVEEEALRLDPSDEMKDWLAKSRDELGALFRR